MNDKNQSDHIFLTLLEIHAKGIGMISILLPVVAISLSQRMQTKVGNETFHMTLINKFKK